MVLDDQNLCIQTSSSFIYGALPIRGDIYVVGDLDTGELAPPTAARRRRHVKLTACLCRDPLRLHPGVPAQHGPVAPDHAHAALRPVQARLRRPPLRQLPPVPPAAPPGNVPAPGLRAPRRSLGSGVLWVGGVLLHTRPGMCLLILDQVLRAFWSFLQWEITFSRC